MIIIVTVIHVIQLWINKDSVTLLLASLGFLSFIKTLLNSALNLGASSQICSKVKEILASFINCFAALYGAVGSLETGFDLALGVPFFFSLDFKDSSVALGTLTNLTSSSSSMSSILTLFLL